jgi:hypothetical protein
MCQKGGFNLTKFISNCVAVNQSIPLEDRTQNIKKLELGQDRFPVDRTSIRRSLVCGIQNRVERHTMYKERNPFKDKFCLRSVGNYCPCGSGWKTYLARDL